MTRLTICGNRLTGYELAALNALIEAAVARQLANGLPEGGVVRFEAPTEAVSAASPRSKEAPHREVPPAIMPAAPVTPRPVLRRPGLIDLKGAPSSMEQAAAGWRGR